MENIHDPESPFLGLTSFPGQHAGYSFASFQDERQPQHQVLHEVLDMPMAIDPNLQTSGEHINTFLTDFHGTYQEPRLWEVNSLATLDQSTQSQGFDRTWLEPTSRHEHLSSSTLDPSSVDPSTPRDLSYSPNMLASDGPEFGFRYNRPAPLYVQQQKGQFYAAPPDEIADLNLSGSPSEAPEYSRTLLVPDIKQPKDEEPSSPSLSTISPLDDRYLPCPFKFAGCRAVFNKKNEWKRHTDTIHARLTYYDCGHRGCASGKRHVFNRRDLFTSHFRRMHFPAYITNAQGDGSLPPEWEEKLKVAWKAASRSRCKPPLRLVCPVETCRKEFRGSTAFDERMEHQARHHEEVAQGKREDFPVGGCSDRSLTEWAESKDVSIVRKTSDGKWELCQAMKGNGQKTRSTRRRKYHPTVVAIKNDDVDAEGEMLDGY